MSTQQQSAKPGIMPSLADLDKPVSQQQKPEDKSQTPPPEDKPKETQQPTAQTPPAKDPATVLAEQAAKEAEEKARAGQQPEEEEEKPEETEDTTGDNNETDNPMAVWEAVNKLRGDEMKWEFPEGIEPDTPEGIHHALRLAEDRAVTDFEETLRREMPRAYSYMLHISNGGTDEDFFRVKTEPLPDLEALKNSVDSQRAFYKRALQRRGVEEEHADLIIKAAIDKQQLYGLVEKEHESMKTSQEAELRELMERDKANRQREKAAIDNLSNQLREHILENKHLNITIPDAKRPGFLQFVNTMIFLDKETNRFAINQEISEKNMALVLEALYYMHVKGNMDDIISKRAAAENTKKLRIKMQKEKKESASHDPNPPANGNKPGIRPALSEL